MHTQVKICGITTAEDATVVASSGVAAVGLVFYETSSRAINVDADVENARAIVAAVPPFVSITGVFVNARLETVHTTLEKVRLDCLQFHGDEPADFCRSFNRSYIKSLRLGDIKNETEVRARYKKAEQCYGDARGLLVDSGTHQKPGGTGATLDWTMLPAVHERRLPLILAGGLHAGNVSRAIQVVQPAGVDVSSGVERAPGVKDASKMVNFINAVRAAEHIGAVHVQDATDERQPCSARAVAG